MRKRAKWLTEEDDVVKETPLLPPRPYPMDLPSLRIFIGFINHEREKQGIVPKLTSDGSGGPALSILDAAFHVCLTVLDGWDIVPSRLARAIFKIYVEPNLVQN